MRFLPYVAVLLLGSGCLGASKVIPADIEENVDLDANAALGFTVPIQINRDLQEGFEPSLRIAPDGTIYIAASRGFLAGRDGATSSLVWFSKDNGTSWTRMPSLLGVREKIKAIEGDLAVDSRGNVYFVDTYAVDNVITVWDPDQRWRSTNPLQGTTGLDDRPWLAAHGDGTLYYLGNSVAPLPGPDDPADGVARIWFYRSVDHGRTWSVGTALLGGDYCHIAANPVDDSTIVLVCSPTSTGFTAPGMVRAFVSEDRGETWTIHELGSMLDSPDDNFPVAAFSHDGTGYVFWLDEGEPGALHLSSWNGTEWSVQEVPTIRQRAANPALAAGRDGVVGLAYYARQGEGWFLQTWVRRSVGEPWEQWMDPTPVSYGAFPPEDFFQAAMDGKGRMHIAYQRNGMDELGVPKPYLQPIVYVQQR